MILTPDHRLRHVARGDLHRVEVTLPDGRCLETLPALTPGEALLNCAELLAGRGSSPPPWGSHVAIIGDHLQRICRATAEDDEIDLLADEAMRGSPVTALAFEGSLVAPKDAEQVLVRHRAECLRELIVDLREIRSLFDALETDPHAGALRASPLWELLADVLLIAGFKAHSGLYEMGVDQTVVRHEDAAVGRVVLERTIDRPVDLCDDAWVERVVSRHMANPMRHAFHGMRMAKRNAPMRPMTEGQVEDALKVLAIWNGTRRGDLTIVSDECGSQRLTAA